MSHKFQILIQNLTHETKGNEPLFKDLNLVLNDEKTGLVGRNGIGKSTLVKLIAGELTPPTGTITRFGKIAVCPQEFSAQLGNTIAEAFDVVARIAALDRILQGVGDENDFAILNEDWTIRERIARQLKSFGLENVALNRKLRTLSSGERTCIFLAKTFFTQADFIILDEPTNNLDIESRHMLYKAIQNWPHGLLVISHDRTLLEYMQQIVELTMRGIKIYGGNYSQYVEQKCLKSEANKKRLEDAKRLVQKTSRSVQDMREKHEQSRAYGKQLRRSNSQAKIILDAMKNRSSGTQKALATRSERLLKKAEQALQSAKENIDEDYEIKITLPKTKVHERKMVIELEDVCFNYDRNANFNMLIKDFSLKIAGPQHVAIYGKNGSGKTTLIRLIIGELQPMRGVVKIGVFSVRYLEQIPTILLPNLTLLENFLRLNPNAKAIEAHAHLARFLFRSNAALQLYSHLSCGEKMRATLACVLMAENPPQLLILDEPTNHLDFENIMALESALKHYEGALLTISHDEKFLSNIGIDRTIHIS